MSRGNGESRFLSHFKEAGYCDIVAIDYDWHEESSGYQTEHTYETVVARKGNDYYKVVGHETARVFSRRSFSIKSAQPITSDEYNDLVAQINADDASPPSE